MLHAPETGAKK